MNQVALLILNALHGIIQWYSDPKVLADINVDGLFGMRVLEGQLKHIWMEYDLGGFMKADRAVILSIKELSQNATKAANQAVPHVFSKQPGYFAKFKYLLSNPFDSSYDIRITDPGKVWSYPSEHEFNETRSDECLAELLQFAPAGDDVIEEIPGHELPAVETREKCDFSSDCIRYMLDGKDWNGYMLQHQILYTIIAEMVGCKDQLESQILTSFDVQTLDDYQTELCTNAVYEMEQSIASYRIEDLAMGNLTSVTDEEQKIPYRGHDLFMEQQFLCGHLGFVEITRREWLDAILSWQQPSGCYLTNDKIPAPADATDDVHFRVRRLLYERTLANGCGAHKTAVAAGALVVYLRFTLENVKENQHMRHLDINNQPASSIVVPMKGKFLPDMSRYEKAAKQEAEEKDADTDALDAEEIRKDEETVREEMDKRKRRGDGGVKAKSVIDSPIQDGNSTPVVKEENGADVPIDDDDGSVHRSRGVPITYIIAAVLFVFFVGFLCRRRHRVWRRWSHIY